MKRREFILGLGAAALTSAFRPRAARAQASGRVRQVGALFAGAESDRDSQTRLAAFRRGLNELGWKEGENIHIEWRWSNGKSELIRQYAQELVALAPDVILANSTPVVTVFKNLTASVPVVFALAIDPVGMGYVRSLARPGGNFTGFTFIDPELIGKWTELLKSVAPDVVRAALLFDPAGSPSMTVTCASLTPPVSHARLSFSPCASVPTPSWKPRSRRWLNSLATVWLLGRIRSIRCTSSGSRNWPRNIVCPRFRSIAHSRRRGA